VSGLALLLVAAVTVPAGSTQRILAPSPTLGTSRWVRVYLPPSYARPESAHRHYPTVYLLHGWPGSDGNWFGSGHADESTNDLIAHRAVPEVILVCPNGNCGLWARTVYMNATKGPCRLEDYLVHDLVSWVDSTYRTERSPKQRVALGLSDGGTAAFNLAIRHPDVFGGCATMSSDFLLQRNEMGLGSFVGPDPDAERLLEEHSPAITVPRHVAQLKNQTIYFDCGTSDESIEQNRRMHKMLDSLGVAHTFKEFPGSHTWGYWRAHFRDALVAVTRGM